MTTHSTLPDALAPEATITTARRVPALDGLRALAVAAVVLYHLSPELLPGGFLGVDAFFVLSGYLVTSSLLRGRRAGQHDLREFWIRRARRILPALLVMLVTTTVVVGLVGRDTDVRLLPQVVSTLTFTNNWYQAHAGSSYFDAGTPPVFQHLWSVSVEEQFYLAWPLCVALWCRGSRRLLPFALVTLGAALLSGAAMAWSFVPGQDPSSIYFGSATHCSGLLLGAALATAGRSWAGMRLPRWVTPSAAVVAATLVVHLPDVSPWAYRGGIFLFSLCITVVVGSIVLAPRAGVARQLLSAPWAVWAGRRSYGIYLWHWPVTVVTAALLPTRPVWVHAAVVVPTTLVCASASWRYLERPVQVCGLRQVARRLGDHARHSPVVHALTIAVIVATVLSVGVSVVRSPDTGAAERTVAAGQVALETQGALGTADSPGPTASTEGATEAGTQQSSTGSADSHDQQAERDGTALPTGGAGDQTTVVGDSVALASAPALVEALPGIEVTARVGMQMHEAPELLSQLHQDGRLRRLVVVVLGTNGSFSTETLDAVLEATGPERQVFFVTAHAPRSWTASVNERLAEFVASHPGTSLVDWDGAADAVTDFAADGIHPGPEGAQVLSGLLTSALEAQR